MPRTVSVVTSADRPFAASRGNADGTVTLYADGEPIPPMPVYSGIPVQASKSLIVVGASGSDDTDELQEAVLSASENVVELDPGRAYRVSDTIYCPPGRMHLAGNGASITPMFGSDYSKPLFKNAVPDASCTLYADHLRILGNCTAFDFRFIADAPLKGLRILLSRIFFNTMSGVRRAGTRLLIADQIDFAGVRNCDVWNADTVFKIGSAPPRRNCTQIEMAMIAVGQTNAIGYLRGVDKALIAHVDASKCNAGLSFGGDNQRIECRSVHIEGLAMAGYSAVSGDIPSDAAGVAYWFADAERNQDIRMRQCSLIDLGNIDGTAVAGARIGRCDNLALQSIEWDGCKIAPASEGSATYKPIINRGRLTWRGSWPYTTEPSLSANGQVYQDTLIRDDAGMWTNSENLLNSSTVLGLTGSTSGTTPPTITEAAGSTTRNAGQSVQFAAAYELTQNVLLPYGWITLDVSGLKTAGAPVLLVNNNTTFADAVRVQFASLNDRERRWRLSFWNPTAGQSYKVGIVGASASDLVHISAIALYQGFAQDEPVRHTGAHILAALPAASTYWLGKTVIVRSAGVADAEYRCLRDAGGSAAWSAR